MFGRRLFISRGPRAEYELFINGSLPSFGAICASSGVDWGTYHEPGGSQIDAMRIWLPDEGGNCRLMSHVVYEALQRLTASPSLRNDELVGSLGPYIDLVGDRGLLGDREQQGLMGELLLLERLMSLCGRLNLPVVNALEAWRGWQSAASRDFSRNGIAVEVKATGRSIREHEISSLHQLEKDPNEQSLYLYSLSVALDGSGPTRLVDQINTVRVMAGGLVSTLDSRLTKRGFDIRYSNAYRLGPAFALTRFTAALFEVHDGFSRLRSGSFVGGGLPQNVINVGYSLNLQGGCGAGNPLSPMAADARFIAMLT